MSSKAVKLSPKEEAFCLAVVKGLSYSDAYREAYNTAKMKPKTVNEKACLLAGKGKVRARIEALRQPIIEKVQMSEAEWLTICAQLARADVRKMFDSFGNPVEIPELPDNEAAAVAGFEFYEDYEGKGESRKAVGYTRKFRLADKKGALELIGKAYGYYKDRKEHTGPNGGPIETKTTVVYTPQEAYLKMVKGQ